MASKFIPVTSPILVSANVSLMAWDQETSCWMTAEAPSRLPDRLSFQNQPNRSHCKQPVNQRRQSVNGQEYRLEDLQATLFFPCALRKVQFRTEAEEIAGQARHPIKTPASAEALPLSVDRS
jgi:hypothetical protein